jgi:hypothetical protein
VDWTGYEIFDPEVDRPLNEVTRAEARRHFDKLMAQKDERNAQLAALLVRNRGPELGDDDAAISALDHWFRDRVEPDPERPHRLLPEWYSVGNDMALHLGDVAIARSPWLHWELFTWGKKDVAYQRPVLMGFRVPDKRYNVDLDWNLAVIGHRQVTGQPLEDEELVPMLHRIAEHAEGRF